jgi:hypothetical protein
MSDKEYNPGFAFYQNFFTSIEHLSIEQQKEICYAIVKYGITGEIVDPVEMSLGFAFTNVNKRSIDESVDRWRLNQNKANYKIDSNMSRDYAIAQLISQGKKSKEIAAEISTLYGEISDSAVRRTEPWKDRDNPDFNIKWLGKNCENSQKLEQREVCVSVNSQNGTECENSQKITKMEQDNNCLLGAANMF